MAANFSKLKSGDWGIRVTGQTVAEGDRVTVTKKDGNTDTVTVAKVVWSGGGVYICAIKPRDGTAGGSRRSGGNVCAECGKGGRLVSDLEDGMMKHYQCCDIPPGGY